MGRFVGLTLLAVAACRTPEARPVSGDIASVLDRAMADGKKTFDHSLWNGILSKHAVDGGSRFDYSGLKKEEDRLEAYLDSLAKADLETLETAELEALFINAYNASTVDTILDRVSDDGAIEIASIRDIEEVFTRKTHNVGGFELSLDDIEHGILRPRFRDPRIHFAVNCASISCPPLPVEAFEGDKIDEQLESGARNALRNPAYVSVEDGKLVLTKILDWYGEDFVSPDFRGSEKNLPAFVFKYATEEVRKFLEEHPDVEVRFRDYDWRLNQP